MVGRQNIVLQGYVEQYAKYHPKFKYVYRELKNGIFNYFSSDGECLGDINTREKYMALLRQSRAGLYSTPGIDGDEGRTNGFNQVTPRFLELIVSGCHILSRYPHNPDTDYYELSKISTNVTSYEQFDNYMNEALHSEVDMNFYSDYIKKHYTSSRCHDLLTYLSNV